MSSFRSSILRGIIAGLVLSVVAGSIAKAGVVTKVDFSPIAFIETFDTFTPPSVEPTPFLLNNIAYQTDAPAFAITDGSGFGLNGASVFAQSASSTTDIFFSAGVEQAGLDIGNIVSLNTNVEFFDQNNQSLFLTTVVNPAGGAEFIGFQNTTGFVSRIRLIDNNFGDGASPVFDNIHVEIQRVPEPSTFALTILGLLSLGMIGRRRSRR